MLETMWSTLYVEEQRRDVEIKMWAFKTKTWLLIYKSYLALGYGWVNISSQKQSPFSLPLVGKVSIASNWGCKPQRGWFDSLPNSKTQERIHKIFGVLHLFIESRCNWSLNGHCTNWIWAMRLYWRLLGKNKETKNWCEVTLFVCGKWTTCEGHGTLNQFVSTKIGCNQ